MENSYHPTERRHAAFALDGDRGTILVARDHTRVFLGELDPPVSPTTTVDVLMLVSELVTNAVRHAPGPCTLYLVHAAALDLGGLELTVAVSDTSTTAPTPRTPDLLEGSGGLGWHMVRRLTTFVRIHFVPARGKTIETTLAVLPPRI